MSGPKYSQFEIERERELQLELERQRRLEEERRKIELQNNLERGEKKSSAARRKNDSDIRSAHPRSEGTKAR